MLLSILLPLFVAAQLSHGLHAPGPRVVKHGMFPASGTRPAGDHAPKVPLNRRQAPNPTGCGSGSGVSAKAPKTNIFAGLTNDETAAVIAFLYEQRDLNLTAASNATAWDNRIRQVDLLRANKTDALAYLDSGASAPERYARVILQFGATEEPYIQEYQVGPLPVRNVTTVSTLNYLYNKGEGKQRKYDQDIEALAAFTYAVGTAVGDITQPLLNGTATGNLTDTIAVAGTTPLIHEDDKIFQWNQFCNLHTGPCFDEQLLPTGLMFKTDITGRDPSKWSVVAWQYDGTFYESEEAFRKAFNSPGFVKTGQNIDGEWACTDYREDLALPNDEIYPPVPVQPEGPRFGVDELEKYVEWMDFSFYISYNRDYGVQLHNVYYKGERIIYEVGINEALAHYASASDPFQGSNAYLDSEYGFGQSSFQLVSGFDCPAYATYLNGSYNAGETSHIHPSSICLFEYDTLFPIQRHTAPLYVAVSKSIAFVVRSAATVGNYDYLFDYEFYLDGSIHISVRASGYIQSSFWTSKTTGEDGFHIHDFLGGSLHDHVLSYKLDMDVAGTKNSLMRSQLVPTTEVYPWSNGKSRNTMKLERNLITNEDDAKLNWDVNNVVTYSVVNTDAKNIYGEYRGWKITPATAQRSFLTIQNSSTLGPSVNWATHHLYALQHHDTEPQSVHPYNAWDPFAPVIDFAKFFDSEPLEQVDLVLYFNLGMHHVPDTADLPNTLFTSAHSAMIIAPQNFLLGDPSRGSVHAARINVINGSVTDAVSNNVSVPTCSLDLGVVARPNLESFVGEAYISKYPYVPDAQMIGNPGAAVEGGQAM